MTDSLLLPSATAASGLGDFIGFGRILMDLAGVLPEPWNRILAVGLLATLAYLGWLALTALGRDE